MVPSYHAFLLVIILDSFVVDNRHQSFAVCWAPILVGGPIMRIQLGQKRQHEFLVAQTDIGTGPRNLGDGGAELVRVGRVLWSYAKKPDKRFLGLNDLGFKYCPRAVEIGAVHNEQASLRLIDAAAGEGSQVIRHIAPCIPTRRIPT